MDRWRLVAMVGILSMAVIGCSSGDPTESDPDAGAEDSGSTDADDNHGVDSTAVALTHPGDGLFGMATDVTLVWQLREFGDTYDVDVARDVEFTDVIVRERDWPELDYPLVGLAEEETYFWRVRAHGEEGAKWSEVRSFETWQSAEKRPAIYQLVVRHFGNADGDNIVDGTIEENGVGKFSDIDEVALSRIRAMGITHVYLTGVIQQATLTEYPEIDQASDDPDILKGRAGSFFAIRDYFDVSPDYADDPENRLQEFGELVDRIHDAGMKVMIDLVPNHVARSYGSSIRPELDPGIDDDQDQFFSPQNNFFYLEGGIPLQLPTEESHWQADGMDGEFAPENGEEGRFVRVTGNNVASHNPPIDSWYETVKLNYGYNFETGEAVYDPRPPTWDFIREVIFYWMGEFGVDGFRADFAHYVPDAFWEWVIAETREEFTDAYFAAEAYENLEGLLQAGFDAVYDDNTYDGLKGIYNGDNDKQGLDSHFASVPDESRGRYLRYLENHDERRIASPLVHDTYPGDSGFGDAQAGRHVAPVAYLFGAGAIMVYNGQTLGEEGSGTSGFSLDDGRSTIFDYWRVPALSMWNDDGRFSAADLDMWQRELHEYYRRLIHLSTHPLAVASGYFGLDFFNRDFEEYDPGLFAFARFEPEGDKIMLVVTNWADEEVDGVVRLPEELTEDQTSLDTQVEVFRIFDEGGDNRTRLSTTRARSQLSEQGIFVSLPRGATRVYLLR